ncbi:uncharacterized protein G6M90_00g064090 [Metarhizium brunneum]|uniref:SnoaL-like domain-containing protein n=1 Tax=Metarhizium brunneum TaxID=500148 RepID=A0A7D5Z208_9HYPO
MIASTIFWAAGAIASLASASSCPGGNFKPNAESQTIVAASYVDIWNGDFSLENRTFAPDVVLYQDRLPGPGGSEDLPVGSSAEFIEFMRLARFGWNHYKFDIRNLAFDGYNVVIRWALNATVGPRDKMLIPINKPEGTDITFNGTDWLYLDECTFKIKQVDSAQDYIRELYLEGITEIKI